MYVLENNYKVSLHVIAIQTKKWNIANSPEVPEFNTALTLEVTVLVSIALPSVHVFPNNMVSRFGTFYK